MIKFENRFCIVLATGFRLPSFVGQAYQHSDDGKVFFVQFAGCIGRYRRLQENFDPGIQTRLLGSYGCL